MKLSEIQNSWWFKLYLKVGPYYSADGVRRYHEGSLTFCDIFWTILWGGLKALLVSAFVFSVIVVMGLVGIAVIYCGTVVTFLHVMALVYKTPFWANAYLTLTPVLKGETTSVATVIGYAADLSFLIILFILGVKKIKNILLKKKVGEIHRRGFISQAWHDFKTKSCSIIELDA